MILKQLFGSIVSSSAFRVIDGEERMVGKFGEVSVLDDGLYDIWLIGRGMKPLSKRKLRSIIGKFPQGARFTELTGEAFTQVGATNAIIKSLSLLGIKRKRVLTEAAKEALRHRLQRAKL